MTNRELASLAVKLMGLYCLVEAVYPVAGLLLLAFRTGVAFPGEVYFVLLLVLLLVMGALLIWKSAWLVKLVFPESGETGSGRVESQHFQAIFFSVVGVVLVVEALPRGVLMILRSLFDQKAPVLNGWLLAGKFTQVAIGLALFFGSTGLARVWSRANEATPKS